MKTRIARAGALAIAATAAMSLVACSSDDAKDSVDSATSSAGSKASSATAEAMDASGPVGPGCADYAKAVPEGEGSISGMSNDPVAVAASNNPLLKTLVSAVSGKLNPDVNLVETLNGGEFTVFAPVDDAFGKIDAATIDTLKTDSALLTKILTYHVVPGRIAPNEIDGEHATVEGGNVEVTGDADDLKVNGVQVICGGVSTRNATVYLIDSVLMPK